MKRGLEGRTDQHGDIKGGRASNNGDQRGVMMGKEIKCKHKMLAEFQENFTDQMSQQICLP